MKKIASDMLVWFMAKLNQTSILVSGVPLSRGTPEHIEHDDETAFTVYDQETGNVTAVHTPKHILQRIHEVKLHALHSDPERMTEDYEGICETVRNITEDCRIHLNHWPWNFGHTPKQIADACVNQVTSEVISQEVTARIRAEKKLPAEHWPMFATKLRAACVRGGISYDVWNEINRMGFSKAERRFAGNILSDLQNNNPRGAALALQAAFFPEYEPPQPPKAKKGKAIPGKRRPGKSTHVNTRHGLFKHRKIKMDIIELPHSVAIKSASVGYRLTTSGPRLYRPALRRPIVSPRLFLRRAPVEPGGTILIDASGSMGDFSQVEKWAEKAPFATVAYYSGRDGGGEGWLYVYARHGFRAAKAVEPFRRGNLVDGLALDWLMKQEGPRVMITDREFCGAADSDAQILRLSLLERDGEITVKPYL